VQQIILLESRLIFVALVLGVVILIFFLNKKNLFKNFVAGILILIISIVMIYQTNANYNFKKTRLYFLQGEKIRSGNEVYNEKIISSTGRTQKWEYLLDDIFKNKYLGSGPESDRRILTTYNFNSGNDAASATIYAFVCGGIIGLLLILIFYLRIIYNCWFLIFKRKIFEGEDLLIKLSVTLVGFLIWRSLFESSFASINFDLFLMLTCVSYIEHVKIKDFYKKK
jgi:O-antigen ligase